VLQLAGKHIDAKSLNRGVADFSAAVVAFRKHAADEPKAPHSRQVPRQLDRLLEAVQQGKEKVAKKTLSSEDRYGLIMAYLSVLRWNNRALLQLARGTQKRGAHKLLTPPRQVTPDKDDRIAPPGDIVKAPPKQP